MVQLEKQTGWKKEIKPFFMELLGGILIAIAIDSFAVNANFPLTGFSGIAMIFYRLFHMPMGASLVLLNIPLALLCYKLLGKEFFFRSIRCTITSSILIDYVGPYLPTYNGDRLLAALCTGVAMGVGYAIIYMQNSSTGGADFMVMALKAVRPHMSIGKLAFITDFFIVVIGGVLCSDIDGIIYGMILSTVFSFVIDKVMYGANSGKMALIVTEHGEMISKVIDDTCMRGCTLLKAAGGYKGDEKQVVMCACSDKQMYGMQQAVKAADPESFMVILESNEVHGEGFKNIKIGE